MHLNRVTTGTDVSKIYSEDITKAQNKYALVEILETWEWVAHDALIEARSIIDWADFRKGLKAERKGDYAGDEWAQKYSAILIPEKMMLVSIKEVEFKVPWIVVYKRMLDLDLISVD